MNFFLKGLELSCRKPFELLEKAKRVRELPNLWIKSTENSSSLFVSDEGLSPEPSVFSIASFGHSDSFYGLLAFYM